MFHVNKQFPDPNVPRTIRFTDNLFQELKQVADDTDVSFNSLVLQCCRYALDHLEQEDGKESE